MVSWLSSEHDLLSVRLQIMSLAAYASETNYVLRSSL